jgi:hypothetical protein
MWTEKVAQFFDLGFTPASNEPATTLMLGSRRPTHFQRNLWQLVSWLFLTCGIFLRKGLAITDLSWVGNKLTLGAFLASAVIGLAIFRPFMRWITKSRPKFGFEHCAASFGFGFFLNLAVVAAQSYGPHWR